MEKLKRRESALESASPSADEFSIIIWRIANPGRLDAQICRLRDDDGSLWTRLPGESEKELIDRASLEAKRSPSGVAWLITAE